MTLYYPDVSNYQGSMPLAPNTVACFAKASEGTSYKDPYYAHFKAEAARVGALFGGYHFLHAGNAAAQAANCFAAVGRGVPVMIDHETTTGSNPTVQDALDFASEYRKLGGLVVLEYLPHWYWQQLGSPSLTPIKSAGLGLVSSDYTSYADNGPGWNAYGGVTPVIWQYTDAQQYSGQPVDFNAFKGTVAELKALLGLAPAPAPVPAPPPIQEYDMTHLISVTPDPTGGSAAGLFLVDGNRVSHVASGEYLNELRGRYGTELVASPADYAAHLAAMTPATANITVDATALAAAITSAMSDSALLKTLAAAFAHAQAVELHDDTPAS